MILRFDLRREEDGLWRAEIAPIGAVAHGWTPDEALERARRFAISILERQAPAASQRETPRAPLLPKTFDEMFDELVAKGYIEQVGIGADGEPEYRLTEKIDHLTGSFDEAGFLDQVRQIARRN
jgi:hypothetical protein